jgi:long-chain fatty acid transport protein
LYDESPIPDDTIDYAMPSDNRHMFTGGFGYKFNDWTIDSHYALVAILGADREINTRELEGIVSDSKVSKSFVHQLGLSLSRSF